MEIMLRCSLPDRPGALATLAGAISEAGGDIQAVDVVETSDGRALDDLVVVIEPERVRSLVQAIDDQEDIELVHAGPSRGHPGDAVTRLALRLELLLNGAMDRRHAVQTLIGGLLRATAVEVVPAGSAPRAGERVLVLRYGGEAVVVRRDYRFTTTEVERAQAILSVAREAERALQSTDASAAG
jgi:hypothetical protein